MTPYERADIALSLQITSLIKAQDKLNDIARAIGDDDPGKLAEVRARIAGLNRDTLLKLDQRAALHTQSSVTSAPSPDEIAALRDSVSRLEGMNAVATNIQIIFDAAINIANAYHADSGGRAGATAAAGAARAAGAQPRPQTATLLASALAGAALTAGLMTLSRRRRS